MKTVVVILGFILAVGLHGGFILFGGLLLPKAKEDQGRLQQVELISEEEAKKEDEKPIEQPPEEIKSEDEPPPDAETLAKALDQPEPMNNEPAALDAASLSAIENALNGGGAGAAGDFGAGADLVGGGVIGGTGKRGGGGGDGLDDAFNLNEIDQKPRPVFQAAPVYPAEMRARKMEGVVSVLFIVSPDGKVANARVEKSNDPAFERPALDAVRKWKFEAAVKGGQRVACKMRVPIRFQPG